MSDWLSGVLAAGLRSAAGRAGEEADLRAGRLVVRHGGAQLVVCCEGVDLRELDGPPPLPGGRALPEGPAASVGNEDTGPVPLGDGQSEPDSLPGSVELPSDGDHNGDQLRADAEPSALPPRVRYTLRDDERGWQPLPLWLFG